MSQSSLPNPQFQPGVLFFFIRVFVLLNGMYSKRNLYGLVLCGGKSSRMGEDKGFLIYHNKPQYQHVFEMLQQCCIETYISCNAEQLQKIDEQFNTIEDDNDYADKGPATGLLTAFSKHPQKDFLVIACDYPLLTEEEIKHFLDNIPARSTAAAFYDAQEECYQSVTAWYSAEAGSLLMQSPQLPLKRLLENLNAHKHTPLDAGSITSADTKAIRDKILQLTNLNH
jgi:molybdenum cofactor guanylyltransferase